MDYMSGATTWKEIGITDHGSIIDGSAEENVLKNENENRYKTKKAPLTGGA